MHVKILFDYTLVSKKTGGCMNPIQIDPTTTVYQPLSEPVRKTFSSRVAERCTLASLLALGTGSALIAMTIYLATHKEATNNTDDFPHDAAFSYYCRESCSVLYNYNPGLVKKCNAYCDGISEDTFPKACVLACNKLGMGILLKCIQSCK